MKDRPLFLNVRIAPVERTQLKALADDADVQASTLVPHKIHEAQAAEEFGTSKTTKKGGAR
jgi:hypothetical protein